MANITTSRTAPFGAVATYRIVAVIENTIEAAKAWNTQRRTVKVLSSLTDRELEDIGLVRGDIAHRTY